MKIIYLVQPCNGDRIPEDEVDCTNIEEDMQGRDVVTFDCPNCGEEDTSLRLG